MSKFDDWKKYLNDLKKNTANEIKFKELERWMIKELEVKKLKNKSGSHFPYSHPTIGIFTIALADDSRTLYRKNFLVKTYKDLMRIVVELETEENSE